MPMSAETKERLRLARLAKRAPKTEAEPIVTHETDDEEWIEVVVRIKRPRSYRAPSGALPSEAQ